MTVGDCSLNPCLGRTYELHHTPSPRNQTRAIGGDFGTLRGTKIPHTLAFIGRFPQKIYCQRKNSTGLGDGALHNSEWLLVLFLPNRRQIDWQPAIGSRP